MFPKSNHVLHGSARPGGVSRMQPQNADGDSAIATQICGARQPRAWRSAQLVIGWFAYACLPRLRSRLDPQKAITQFVHAAWTEKDGAPADIEAITQTKD